MRVLVLTSTSGWAASTNNAIYEALESRGIPREIVNLPISGSLQLMDGSVPRYYAIVVVDNGASGSPLSLAQQTQVRITYAPLPSNFNTNDSYLFFFLSSRSTRQLMVYTRSA